MRKSTLRNGMKGKRAIVQQMRKVTIRIEQDNLKKQRQSLLRFLLAGRMSLRSGLYCGVFNNANNEFPPNQKVKTVRCNLFHHQSREISKCLLLTIVQ